jgi:hypothetical protein
MNAINTSKNNRKINKGEKIKNKFQVKISPSKYSPKKMKKVINKKKDTQEKTSKNSFHLESKF